MKMNQSSPSTVLGPPGEDLYTAMDHHRYGNTDMHVCTAVVTWGGGGGGCPPVEEVSAEESGKGRS